MTSICMCTYNGDKYIREQLDCIKNQTLRPDEVIIVDDCSTDDTAKIIAGFIENNKLEESWHFEVNSSNRGYPGNFYYCMSLAKGDVVFLADQDDIWRSDKIEVMTKLLENNADMEVLCASFGLVDDKNEDIHSFMNPHISHGNEEIKYIDLKGVFRYNAYPGMAMAYKKAWFDGKVKELDTLEIKCMPHDLLLCILASSDGRFSHIKDELCFHRRHDNNAGEEEHRISKNLDKTRKIYEVQKYIGYLEELDRLKLLQGDAKAVADEWKSNMEDRLSALKSGHIVKVLGNGIKHRKDARLKTIVCDALITRQRTEQNG